MKCESILYIPGFLKINTFIKVHGLSIYANFHVAAHDFSIAGLLVLFCQARKIVFVNK